MATDYREAPPAGFWTNRRKQQAGRWVAYLGLLLLVLMVGIPLFWMVSGSLKTTKEIRAIPTVWLPAVPQWSNFTDAWNAAPFGRFYINTLITTAIGSSAELINAVMTAYALAFLKFPKKNLIFVLILVALMIPDEVVIVPNYLTVANVFGHSWVNTYQGIIIPGASVAFGAFFLRQAFMGLAEGGARCGQSRWLRARPAAHRRW